MPLANALDLPAIRRGTAILLWLPPMLWAALILSASGDRLSAMQTYGLLARTLLAIGLHPSPWVVEHLNAVSRKSAHLLEYAILFWLWFQAWRTTFTRGGAQRYAGPLLLVLAVACTDETLQSFTRERGASVLDVILDMSGGLAAAIVSLTSRRSGSG